MAPRRRRRDALVALLPFLSVLACVIGTLTLVLAAMAVGSMGGSSLEQLRLSERYEAATRWLEARRGRLDGLRDRLVSVEASERDEARLRERLVGLGLSPDISLADLEEVVRMRKAESELDEERMRLARQRQAQAQREQALQAELERRERLRDQAPIIIEPSGMTKRKRPFFVECGEDYVDVHSRTEQGPFRILADELRAGEQFRRFLKMAGRTQDGLVVFLVRPEGIEACELAADLADRHGVQNARLPLPGEGRLEFGAQ